VPLLLLYALIRKQHSCAGTKKLVETVVELEIMLRPFRRGVTNKCAAGVNTVSVDELVG